MAETAISVAIETIGTLLRDKIGFLRGVNDRVQNLQNELETMRCFLEDADRKQDEDALIRIWVSQVRDVSIDAEDAVELFITKMESIKRMPRFIRFAYCPVRIYYHNKVGERIESIQLRIRAIDDNRQKYGIEKLGEGSREHAQELRLLRATVPYSQENIVVGIDEKVAFLVSQILKEDCNRFVFSVTGMGGIGKTTLARQIYNCSQVQVQFSCHAWIYVSERYNFREIVKGIIKQVELTTNDLLDRLEKMDDVDLKRNLYQCLKGKRYLVVLDDIWQKQVWDVLDEAFPDEGEGGRVLLTTRIKSVAQHASSFLKPYELQTLGDGDSWELFSKNIFSDGKCPSFLEDIGRKIVKKCGGLPLAIATIARLLHQKNMLQSEWENVLNDINGHLSRGTNGFSAILELSYHDLSPELKFCFKYLGLYPEDHEISVEKLARFWVAEGIVGKGEGSKCLEEIAGNHLEQLIKRNLVQVAYLTVDDKMKSCRVHDLLRDLAIKKGRDENFLDIVASDYREISRKSTHLAAHDFPFLEYLNPRLRTLFIFKTTQFERINFKGIKLLRVLDLEDTKIQELPKDIGDMSLLRYIGLNGFNINKLPPSLGRLQHLQFLNVHSWKVTFPRSVMKLGSLLHLKSSIVRFNGGGPLNFEGLKGLRSLSYLYYPDLMKSNIVMALTSLEKLGIWISQKTNLDKMFMLLSQLRCLSSLTLRFNRYVPFIPCDDLSLDEIYKLNRLNELKIVEGWSSPFAFPPLPPNLSRLYLKNLFLDDDLMPMLATMKCLSFLKLYDTYGGERMVIPKNGFYRLNFLELNFAPALEEICLENGALSKVQCLRIRKCRMLKNLPEEITSMKSLQKLELVGMPKEFIERLQGPDSYKVSQVATLNILS